MKNKFLSQFDAGILRRTLILLIIALVLIAIPIIGNGMNDNSWLVIFFYIGFGLFFFALLYPWRKASYYLILSMVFLILFALLWLFGVSFLVKLELHDKRAEDIAWFIGFACFIGVIASMIGIFIFTRGWQRIPCTAAAVSILTIAIMMSPLMSPPPILNNVLLTVERIFMGLQLLIAIILFKIGSGDIKESKQPKIVLTVITIVLILMAIWELSTLFLDPSIDFRYGFWNTQIRIIAVLQIIIALITFLAYYKISKITKV
jgi:hypothetical protein